MQVIDMLDILSLPNEILNIIIASALPDDFERLALTCKKLHTLSASFIPRHNARRRQFTHFDYNKEPQSPLDLEIRTAWDLICCIAAEPVLPYYIINADLGGDTSFLRYNAHGPLVDVYACSAAIDLIKSSPFIREAGIDPEWLIKEIAQHSSERSLLQRYSQEAAAFVITLLPNAVSLTLPMLWRPHGERNHSTPGEHLDKLQSLVGAVTKPTLVPSAAGGMPLLRVTKIALARDWWHGPPDYTPFTEKLAPFSSLPRLRQLHFEDCVDINIDEEIVSLSGNLEVLHLENCLLQKHTLSSMLDYTPNLKVFKYSHRNKRCLVRVWAITEFFNLLGRKSGSRLEELSITTEHHEGRIVYPPVNMSLFECLRRLEIDLIYVSYMSRFHQKSWQRKPLREGDPAEDPVQSSPTSLYDILVPITVIELSIIARHPYPLDRNDHTVSGSDAEGLEELVSKFSDNTKEPTPALKYLLLDCAPDACETYRNQCEVTREIMERQGVATKIRSCPPLSRGQRYSYYGPQWHDDFMLFYKGTNEFDRMRYDLRPIFDS